MYITAGAIIKRLSPQNLITLIRFYVNLYNILNSCQSQQANRSYKNQQETLDAQFKDTLNHPAHPNCGNKKQNNVSSTALKVCST